MTPQPAAKIEEILLLFNELAQLITPPSQFELARLDTAIRNLCNVDTSLFQCFRGLYYALQGDLINTDKWFAMSICTEPTNPDIYMNYATALVQLHQYDKALKIALEGICKDSFNPKAVHNLLLSAYFADDRATIDEWLPKYEKLTGVAHEVAIWIQEDVEDDADIKSMRERDIRKSSIDLNQLCKELGL